MIEFLKPVATDLQALEPLLVEYLRTPNAPTNQILAHIFGAGGKRVRPGLFLLTCALVEYTGEHKFPIASVCEYIHTASLLHDDVIDNSTLRRNKPTVNSVWGDETAVLAGDLIYSAACRLMVRTQSLELIDTFAECIRFMSESELFQLDLLWNIDTTEEQSKRVVAGKTGALFEASTMTPAFLQKCPNKIARALGEFGKNLGFAFQIADDCLDYEGSTEVVGKTLVADLFEGKVTLPVILAMQLQEGHSLAQANVLELRALVTTLLESGQADDAQKTELVTRVRACGGVQRAYDMAQGYAQKAAESLNQATELLLVNRSVLAPAQRLAAEALSDLTASVVWRKK